MPAGLESEFAPNSLRIIGFHRMNTKSAVRMTGALKEERKQPEKKSSESKVWGENHGHDAGFGFTLCWRLVSRSVDTDGGMIAVDVYSA